jgi:hypothetical protein
VSTIVEGTRPGVGTDLADDLAATGLALARAIAAGATLFCCAPDAPAHARHVAVEFLHPVIVGKRAVPALAVDERDALAEVRFASCPGDVLVALGPGGHPLVGALLRRAPTWGLMSIWFDTAAGPDLAADPGGVTADHVLRVGPDSGGLGVTLGYHLLWELTHVVFEHPGLLDPDLARSTGDVCVTCADECAVVEVQTVGPGGRVTVRAGGREETVDASLVDGVTPNTLLLAQAGVALARVEEPV